HFLKYSLFYGLPGQRIVLYDNERGKGDHRHYGPREEAYQFVSVERLLADFRRDVEEVRGEAI
ncbi:toxin-antitoxin system TumE family protein, partial [Rhizobium sp. UBA1881]